MSNILNEEWGKLLQIWLIKSWYQLLTFPSVSSFSSFQCPMSLPLKWFPLPLLLHSSCFAAAVFRLSTLFWNSSPLFTLLCYSPHFLASSLFLAFWVSKIVFFKTNFLIDTYSKNYRHTHTHTHTKYLRHNLLLNPPAMLSSLWKHGSTTVLK